MVFKKKSTKKKKTAKKRVSTFLIKDLDLEYLCKLTMVIRLVDSTLKRKLTQKETGELLIRVGKLMIKKC